MLPQCLSYGETLLHAFRPGREYRAVRIHLACGTVVLPLGKHTVVCRVGYRSSSVAGGLVSASGA